MPIHISNSLTRKKEDFKPIDPPNVSMYVCGPTVYDEPHIGHARSAYIFDVIRRFLVYRGYKVKFVRNVTDVDDKIIDKARKEFPDTDLINATKKISVKYLNAYHEDMKSLGIMEPDFEPKATDYVNSSNPSMQKFIAGLIERGAAYVAAGDVYFDIKKAKGYGKLSNQSLAKMEVGARVLAGENKRDPLDFALWKSAKEGEPAWDSPWGQGRPGWHIECSVMSSDILGDEFDIHGGGLDLIFPHHENEVAQSEGAGKAFAHYWIHHGLLTINGQKMAKSLGNFVTIKDFIAKYKHPDLLKLFFLSAHYAHPIDYNTEKITEASKQKQSFNNFFDKVSSFKVLEGKSLPLLSTKEKEMIDEICLHFEESMDDDFNTPKALAALFELIDFASAREGAYVYAKDKLQGLFKILGLVVKPNLAIPKEVSDLIDKRNAAKKNKDFKKSDEIRKELKDKYKYLINDTGNGWSLSAMPPEE